MLKIVAIVRVCTCQKTAWTSVIGVKTVLGFMKCMRQGVDVQIFSSVTNPGIATKTSSIVTNACLVLTSSGVAVSDMVKI